MDVDNSLWELYCGGCGAYCYGSTAQPIRLWVAAHRRPGGRGRQLCSSSTGLDRIVSLPAVYSFRVIGWQPSLLDADGEGAQTDPATRLLHDAFFVPTE